MVVNLGDYANDEDMHHNCEIGKKTPGASTAIAPGKGVFYTPATALWAITGSGSAVANRTGIIPNKYPLNVDADTWIQVETRKGTAMYVQAGGAIKQGGRCVPDASGKFIAAGATGVTGVNEYIYEGHEGENIGTANAPTDCILDEKIRVRIA